MVRGMAFPEPYLSFLKIPLGGFLLGLGTGTLTGLFGAGGGFILTPALNIILGLPYNLAVGTSTCQILAASAFALHHHLDRRLLGIRVAGLTGIGIPLGTYLGVRVVNNLRDLETVTVLGRQLPGQEFCFTAIFSVFLTLIAGWLIWDNFFLRRHGGGSDAEHTGYLAAVRIPPLVSFRTIPSGAFSAPLLVALGVTMGFLGGLLGIGGGVIMMPILFYLIGQETKYATLTSTMLVFATALFSSVLHAIHGNIDFVLVLFLIGGAFAGARLGAAIHRRITGHSIRKWFAFVVLAAVAMVLAKGWFLISRAPAVSGSG